MPARTLAPGEFLFAKDEVRGPLYRVETGALCHYIQWDDGRHDIIEFAFPGDIIGFGHLAKHISTAQAIADTVVSVVDARYFEDAIEQDGQLAARVAVAADREFEYVRARATSSGDSKPVERVASLLAVLSHMNVPEGRDPALISCDLASDVAAEQLHMSADKLAGVLGELERRGLVEPSAAGLRILDMSGLEKLADAA
jgi:CRP/FNR family transcriptional regulator